jgi:hypothetical protein
MRTIGRELRDSRRSAAIRRLRTSSSVAETREPNLEGHPPYYALLHAVVHAAADGAA